MATPSSNNNDLKNNNYYKTIENIRFRQFLGNFALILFCICVCKLSVTFNKCVNRFKNQVHDSVYKRVGKSFVNNFVIKCCYW